MKRKLWKPVLVALAVTGITAGTRAVALAEQPETLKYHEMEATAYCDIGRYYDETVPREGITCAAAKEYIGKTFVVYDENWTLIGIYECHDTGGDDRIKNGTVVDLYMNEEEDCWKFGRKKVYVQIVDAKG